MVHKGALKPPHSILFKKKKKRMEKNLKSIHKDSVRLFVSANTGIHSLLIP